MGYLLQHVLTDTSQREPDAEAVRSEGRSLTYAEVDAASDRLARALIAAGVVRGDRVGLYLAKSSASVIGVFGILKAGAAYVPLDVGAPPARNSFVIRDCGIRVLVTSASARGLIELSAEAHQLEVLVETDEASVPKTSSQRVLTWAEVLAQPAGPPQVGTIETDLAYILYTSGSTGSPKGVMISHRTILTFIRWCGSTFGLRRGDRVTSHAPLHFDLSTFDLYVTLDAGATVVLVPDGLSVFPVRLVELLRDERITVAYLVPSIWSLMLTYGALERDSLPDLRLALFAGEVFPIKYLRDLVARLPAARYFNLYGPTETNVCTYYEVQPRDIAPEESRPVPIGVACENTEILVLDDDGQVIRTPEREGELWVRGSTVAAGYWGDPTGTAVRFVQNPFETRYPDVAYRTGDVVRLDENGVDWRYVGRRDHMVKSRGYRIELGEIESTLYAHPDVEEAAAVAVPDELIGARIVAYVVASSSATSPDVLLEHCRRRLPRYMLPERIELCDRLPKTSTGKVDRPSLAIT